MPSIFDKSGVTFQYPENWVLEVDDAQPGAIAATVIGPTGAFWSVAMHPRDADLKALTDAALDAMRQEYPSLEAEPVEESVQGHELIGHDLDFFYVDLVGKASVRAVRLPWTTFTIHGQCEDRESSEIEPVFRAMTYSLLTNSAP